MLNVVFMARFEFWECTRSQIFLAGCGHCPDILPPGDINATCGLALRRRPWWADNSPSSGSNRRAHGCSRVDQVGHKNARCTEPEVLFQRPNQSELRPRYHGPCTIGSGSNHQHLLRDQSCEDVMETCFPLRSI